MKLRILWLTVNRSHRIANHFDDFRQAVTDLPEVEVVTLMKNIDKVSGRDMWKTSRALISNQLVPKNIVTNYLSKDPNFDFVFCDAFFAYLNEDWKTISKTPSAIFIEDIHQDVPKHQIKAANDIGIPTIFHRFNFAFHKYHPKAKTTFNCIWLPHSVQMKRFNDTISKKLDVLHLGVHPQIYYPNRAAAIEQLKFKPYFRYYDRPKDASDEPRDNKWPIDRDYDNLLQSAKICITGGSVFNVPVQKYVEIPAANSLLMSNWFPDLGLLGFIDGTNMVSYHKENLVKVVEDLLKNEEKISRISDNGHNLILMRHTSEIRAKQFSNYICQLIDKKPLYDVESCSFQVNFKPDRIKFKQTMQEAKPKPPKGRDNWRERIANG